MWLDSQKRNLWCSKENVSSTRFNWILFLTWHLLLETMPFTLVPISTLCFLSSYFLFFKSCLFFLHWWKQYMTLKKYYLRLSSFLIMFAGINFGLFLRMMHSCYSEIFFYSTSWPVPLFLASLCFSVSFFYLLDGTRSSKFPREGVAEEKVLCFPSELWWYYLPVF